MIELNKVYTAKEEIRPDFSPAPEGDYLLKVIEIREWKQNNPQTIAIIQRDEKGVAIKDDKGKNVTVSTPDVVVHNTFVTFEIVGGDHAGKRVFHNLTTHPNAPFSIPSFLHALGVENMMASQIPTACVGLQAYASVEVNAYAKTTVDKNTGLQGEEVRESNRVKFFKKMPEELKTNQPTNNNESVAGI